MKYFKNEKNEIYAFEADGSQDDFIPDHLTAITEAEAMDIAIKPPTPQQLANQIRAERDNRIVAVSWRFERYAREGRLGLSPTDDIAVLDSYVQALADITKQATFPQSVDWPVAP